MTRWTLGDQIRYTDADGNWVDVAARFVGHGQHLWALELDDGRIELVPETAIVSREESPGPEPVRAEVLIDRLRAEFGAEERFRGHQQASYVIGLVLAAPLPETSERRVRAILQRAGRFMQNVKTVFERFAKSMHLPLKQPRYPLVMLIFETDELFNAYNLATIQGAGLAAEHTAGFYSANTNRLAIRLGECMTFETPLHEAIHQLAYNRGLVQRLAPIPAWFNEGLATSFEGDGERITVSPARICLRYAENVRSAQGLRWSDLLIHDELFRGETIAGAAYANAWGLHWLLVTRHEREYADYVKRLAQKLPLQTDEADERQQDFQEAVGQSIDALQLEFPRMLAAGLRRQHLTNKAKSPPGIVTIQSNLADVRLSAVTSRGVIRLQGRLRNASQLRPMSFCVAVVTDAGTCTWWRVSKLDVGEQITLKPQSATRVLPGARGGPASSFQVRVRSTLPGSPEEDRWRQGQLPGTLFRLIAH